MTEEKAEMKLYSNEIVFRGHPDKVCDQISAAIGDELKRFDRNARFGIETAGGKGVIFITGEARAQQPVDIQEIARRVLRDVGYSDDYVIMDNIGKQSQDISMGVDIGGAGDQGMMFGYACSDTKELLPTAQVILQRFAAQYDDLRKADTRFKPDGKAQITGEYDESFNLMRIKTFTISYQNTELQREETDSILRMIAQAICNDYEIGISRFLINPTGRFEVGGFEGDAGLTGRKIVVDAYQSFANVGGGCMNGKDASKVDFSAAHKAREIAMETVKAGAKWAEVQLSYAIGIAEPLAIYITTDSGEIEPSMELYSACTPKRIINDLKLLDISYEELAKYGHFGGKNGR
jgi:S-adenosylmethionine synthetase